MAPKVSKGRPESPLGSDTILLLNHNLICCRKVSPLRRRAEGFAVIVAPLSTSAFGGLATGDESLSPQRAFRSPFGNLRGRPLDAILFMQHSI